MASKYPIAVFDSGFGGLTVLNAIRKKLPQYDYCYLGDNARAPYGNRSYQTVYEYTKECVQWFFNQGYDFVILACNTASAKALRTIQQKDLTAMNPNGKVLGVLRPTTEKIGSFSKTGHIGVLATTGTVQSGSYALEIEKFFPGMKVWQEACPMWVPLVENNEFHSDGADYFIQKNLNHLLQKHNDIDTILLGCTHYPLLADKIKKYLPENIKLVGQGEIVAESLENYLNRHDEIKQNLTSGGTCAYYTSDSAADFNAAAAMITGDKINAIHTNI